MVTLGATYEDVITGFRGVATGYVTYITGCNQVLLAPRADTDGKLGESLWFDEQRLTQRVDERTISLTNPPQDAGPDRQAPVR